MKALLLQRLELDGGQAHKTPQEPMNMVHTVKDLGEVIQWVRDYGMRK